jgi:hypothetical protein
MIQEKVDNGIDEPLYSSRSDEPRTLIDQVSFKEMEPINLTLRPSLTTPQTVTANSVILQPDLSKVPEKLPVIIDETKLSKAFPVDTASQIISDIENEIPLSDKVTKILISRNIIKEATPAETVEAIQVVPVNKNPVIGYQGEQTPEVNKVIKVNPPVKGGIINDITNFIYKLIFVTNG